MEHHENYPENKKTTQKTIQKIISLIKENPSITRNEIARLIGDITADGVKYHITKLQKSGILERVGADKGGYWKINK